MKISPFGNDILNIVANGIFQGLTVYGIMIMVYVLIVEKRVDEYMVNFVKKIFLTLNGIFFDINMSTGYLANVVDLDKNREEVRVKIKEFKSRQKTQNHKILMLALSLVYVYVALLAIIIGVMLILRADINWIGYALGVILTIIGASYEYYFITVVVLNYNFITLTKFYDVIAEKVEEMSISKINQMGYQSGQDTSSNI